MNPKRQIHEVGKIPPQDAEIEAAVLGAIMLEKTALVRSVPLIHTEEIFYLEKHQLIMKAIRNLFSESQVVDILTVTAELRKMGKLMDAGGAYYITELTSKVAGGAHIENHIRLLQEFWMKRDLLAIGFELQREGFDDQVDVFNILDKLQLKVIKMIEGIDNGRTLSTKEAMTQALDQVKENMVKKDSITGVPTPFNYLNGLISGWQKTDLVIIAARPAMGKTALMMALARCALSNDFGVGIFSLEMSSVQLMTRLIVQETKLFTAEDIKRGRLSESDFSQLTAKLSRAWNYNLQVDDTPGLSLVEFRSKAWAMKTNHDIQMIIVDYLQLMSAESNGSKPGLREQEIATISRGLKKTAKELEIPVIALSQLSRAVELRSDKRPMLSDLRESGAIEQDADMVFFVYRPEYYGIKESKEGLPTDGLGELICAKHRHGGLGTQYMKFQPEYVDFVDFKDDAANLMPKPAKSIPKPGESYEPSPEEYPDEDDMPF